MALALYPLTISPATLGQNYSSENIVPVGGTAPYVWSTTGSLPPGLVLNTNANASVLIAGRPLVADQYTNDVTNSIPVIQNASTFTVHCTDALSATATVTYTMPVYLFSEKETISVYEMLASSYQVSDPTLSNYYIAMGNMGTIVMKIGEIGVPLKGGLTLILNAYLNGFTKGMHCQLREYIRVWDKIKLVTQKQSNGAVDGISGLSMDWQQKRQQLLGLIKTLLPAYTMAEINARNAHQGGSDSTGSVTGGGGDDGSLSVN